VKPSAITVGELARSAGLTRSTLLYYDRIGLLRPTGRSAARYRLYGDDARRRLDAIRAYRGVGLALGEIRTLLGAQKGGAAAILTQRLERLNDEIGRLREQQRVIVRLLANRALYRRARSLDKRRWVEILAAAGLDEPQMHRWHIEFEARAPEGHQDFLESLGIPLREIAAIRAWSKPRARKATRRAARAGG
jgi:MerR family transcriptional regulator, thiopeptide resistance regulator